MELVGSGFRRNDYLPSAAASEGRVVVAALQRELLDRVDAGRVEERSVGAAVVDVGAVDRPVVRTRACTVDRNLSVIRQTKPALSPQLIRNAGLQQT